MHRLNRPKPDIRVFRSGNIILLSDASRKMGLDAETRISFFTDDEGELFIRKDGEGLRPCRSNEGMRFKYHSAETARQILSLPDIPEGTNYAGFRIGEPDDGESFPVITRRIL